VGSHIVLSQINTLHFQQKELEQKGGKKSISVLYIYRGCQKGRSSWYEFQQVISTMEELWTQWKGLISSLLNDAKGLGLI